MKTNTFVYKIVDCGPECATFYIDAIIGKKRFPNAMQCVLDKKERTILIGDIIIEDGGTFWSDIFFHYTKYINKGYGSKMMKMLLNYAKENNYKKIIGNLSPKDEGDNIDPYHRERQIHFYKKFGFKILPNEEKPKTIELNL